MPNRKGRPQGSRNVRPTKTEIRCYLELLRDAANAGDVRAYQVAAGYDEARARRKACLVSERADRIRHFLAGHRQGVRFRA